MDHHTPISDAERRLHNVGRVMASGAKDRPALIEALRQEAKILQPDVMAGWTQPPDAIDVIYDIANSYDLADAPEMLDIMKLVAHPMVQKGEGQPQPSPPDEEILPPHLSDDALALRFIDKHIDDRCYVNLWGCWMRWTGTKWERDETLDTYDAVRVIGREAAATCTKKTAAKTALLLTSGRTIASIERLAKSDQRTAMLPKHYDADPDVFGTPEMTIDLKTGDIYAPRREDYITKLAAVGPAETPCPMWLAFLDRVTNGNAELIGFLQRYVGYCLTGDVSEHVFAFLHGGGANGKSTFINTVAGILGAHATVVPMELFMGGETERHPTERAKLLGARLAIGHETQRGRKWDEATIQKLTGGDPITARFMRQDFFDFNPTHKFLIAGNHKPNLSGVTEAIRRRLLLVPFTVQIPPEERDTELPEKLKTEWPAILRWMIEGCMEWRRIGLKVPTIVRDASEAYFAEEDTIAQWIEECTVPDACVFTRTRAMFASWKAWSEGRNIRPGNEKAFSQYLETRYQKTKDPSTRQIGFWGLCLRESQP
jgi:putative DNA primase/helicase